MKKSKTDKTMTVEIIGPEGVGVVVNGEICMSGDVVSVGVNTGKNLIYRERAKPHDKASAKAPAKPSEAEAKK